MYDIDLLRTEAHNKLNISAFKILPWVIHKSTATDGWFTLKHGECPSRMDEKSFRKGLKSLREQGFIERTETQPYLYKASDRYLVSPGVRSATNESDHVPSGQNALVPGGQNARSRNKESISTSTNSEDSLESLRIGIYTCGQNAPSPVPQSVPPDATVEQAWTKPDRRFLTPREAANHLVRHFFFNKNLERNSDLDECRDSLSLALELEIKARCAALQKVGGTSLEFQDALKGAVDSVGSDIRESGSMQDFMNDLGHRSATMHEAIFATFARAVPPPYGIDPSALARHYRSAGIEATMTHQLLSDADRMGNSDPRRIWSGVESALAVAAP